MKLFKATNINLTIEEFFSDYWRKKPLFLKGGAENFLGRPWTPENFTNSLKIARTAKTALLRERERELVFIEKVSDFDAELNSLAINFSKIFGTHQAWFDTVHTTVSDSGIGSHFDHSDNFVLQQTGTKMWTLSSPKHIPKPTVARRMMNDSKVGAFDLPNDSQECLEFILEPGDLLYIPLFWIHSGISTAESLSLSLVCPALSLQSTILPLLIETLKRKALGYQPIPAFPQHLSQSDKENLVKMIKSASEVLIEKVLNRDDHSEMILNLQTERLQKFINL